MNRGDVLAVVDSSAGLNDISCERSSNLGAVSKYTKQFAGPLTLLPARNCSPVWEVTEVRSKSRALSDKDLNGKNGNS